MKVTLTTFVIERVIFRLVGAASQLVEELVARCVQPVYNDNTLMEFQRGCENLMISGLPKVTWNDAMQVHERMAAK